MYKGIILIFAVITVAACNNNQHSFDATGNFEAVEVLVSPEIAGKILELNVEEGQLIPADSVVAIIDAASIALQREQVEASLEALSDKTSRVQPQVELLQQQRAVQQTRLDYLQRELRRIQNLYAKDAATGKQVDDLKASIEQLQEEMKVTAQQIKVQQDQVATQNRAVLSEHKPLSKRIDQLTDQLNRSKVVNPVSGTVIAKYAEVGEMASPGKPLYKIADLSQLILRAYISGDQLLQAQLGQGVKVWIDAGEKGYRALPGTIQWISDKAEFTPKTIQTRNERANLVYAIKILVPNDGSLKLGMYAEMSFEETPNRNL
jgi:HlyD family secretion protein